MLEGLNKVPEYTNKGLRKKDLKNDPIEQFKKWYEQACELGALEATTMALSTASPDGQVTLRSVLLKGFDARGFVFFTNYGSTKSKQIEKNPHVALLFRWLSHHRQITILGNAMKTSPKESHNYFSTRPRSTRIGAWVSRQSSVVSSRDVLSKKLIEMKQIGYSLGLERKIQLSNRPQYLNLWKALSMMVVVVYLLRIEEQIMLEILLQ